MKEMHVQVCKFMSDVNSWESRKVNDGSRNDRVLDWKYLKYLAYSPERFSLKGISISQKFTRSFIKYPIIGCNTPDKR